MAKNATPADLEECAPLKAAANGDGEEARPFRAGSDGALRRSSVNLRAHIAAERAEARRRSSLGADYGSTDGRVVEHEHFSSRSPWLRAAVLGANDGLVSVSSLLMGVCGGGAAKSQIVLAGVAGLIGGMFSMALGEWVSVHSQRDSEMADIRQEEAAQAAGEESRQAELRELTNIYIERGLKEDLAKQVAVQLTEVDVIRAHARDELGIDLDELANPLQAALTSAVSFASGAILPLLAAQFVNSPKHRAGAIFIVCVLGLAVCGAIGARLGGSSIIRGASRVTIGGAAALAATFAAGALFGTDAAA